MPVVNVPQDTRWGDLGKGIAGLIGGVLGGIADKQLSSQVAEIMADPKISEEKKPMEILKQLGAPGVTRWDVLKKAELQAKQIENVTSQIGARTIENAYNQARTDTLLATNPQAAALQKARIDELTGQAAQAQASANATNTLLGPRVQALQAETAEKTMLGPPTALLRTQQATKAEMDAEQTRLENEALRAKGAGGVPNFDTMLAPYKLSPEEATTWRNTLTETYRAAKVGQEGTAIRQQLNALATGRQREAKAEEVHPLEEGSAKVARSANEHAAVTEKFANVLRTEPQNFGLLSGAGLKARLDRMGIPVGDPGLLEALEEQKLLAATQAKSGSMFMSAQTIALGRDISPNVDRSPLSNWKAIDAVATQRLAEVNSELARYEGVTPKRQVKPLLEAKEKWERVQALSSSIKTNVSADGNRTVMYFDGKQVDPLSFKTLVDPAKTYDLGGGFKATGFDLKLKADKAGTDPATALKQYRQQYKYTGRE